MPENIEEAVCEIMSIFQETTEGWEDFLLVKEEKELIMYHYNLGRWIRNNWGLWDKKGSLYKELTELGFTTTDDMSQALIEYSWHSYHNTKDKFSFSDKVKRAKEFWSE